MLGLLKRYRELILVAVLLVVPLGVFFADAKQPVERSRLDRAIVWLAVPVEKAVGWSVSRLVSVWDGYVGLRGAHGRASELTGRVTALELERQQLLAERAEAARLRGLLAFAERSPERRYLGARVIGVRLGTVGVPYPGVQLRLGDEGEIQARGPSVTRGYWRHEEATRAAFTADGWFRTGDIGRFDADGFLQITDRLKDLIVTAGGKNVAPQPLEQRVAAAPHVAQAVLLGDRRPYTVMLVVPDFEVLAPWARAHGLDPADRERLCADPRVVAHFTEEVERRLENAARYEQPKKVAVLPLELTVENGLLTPSLKVRRRALEERFRELVQRLYGQEAAA